ncbi:MAG: hypothetical protein KC609_00335 [Myxococcales bacterium]|nr:hypothetical protein [Myxococcales bacterium]
MKMCDRTALRLLLLAFALGLALGGCGKPQKDPTEAPTGPNEKNAPNEPTADSLKAVKKDKSIDLSKGIDEAFWAELPAYRVKMSKQPMQKPFSHNTLDSLSVKAFHNRKEIYIHLSWADPSESRDFGVAKFSDAVAVMWPVDTATQSMIIMGTGGKVNIWQWRGNLDRKQFDKSYRKPLTAYVDYYYPFEKKEARSVQDRDYPHAVIDYIAKGFATITPKSRQSVEGRGFWHDGRWNVVIKRALVTEDAKEEAQIVAGDKMKIAFAVWNGGKRDTGGRKFFSGLAWLTIDVEK